MCGAKSERETHPDATHGKVWVTHDRSGYMHVSLNGKEGKQLNRHVLTHTRTQTGTEHTKTS